MEKTIEFLKKIKAVVPALIDASISLLEVINTIIKTFNIFKNATKVK